MDSSKKSYIGFVAEGGAFIGALAFTNHQTVLPSLILDQNGPGWLAALAPSLMVIGLFTAPVFTYRWVEALPARKPFVLKCSFLQRSVFLLAGCLLIAFPSNPLAILLVLSLSPLLSGILGGVCLTAWQQWFMEEIPARRRASNIGIRFLTGGIIGVFAGLVIEHVLATHPGAKGYGYLHLTAGVLGVLSVFALLPVRESPSPSSQPRTDQPKSVKPGFGATAKQWTNLLTDRKFTVFWLALILMHALLLITPFYAFGLRTRFDQGADFLGKLAFWQMIGATVGNLLAGVIGDVFGGKRALQVSAFGMVLALLSGLHATTLLSSKLAYMAFGLCFMMLVVSKDSYVMENAPGTDRSLFLSLVALVSMFAMVGFSLLSYMVWTSTLDLRAIGYPSCCAFVILALILFQNVSRRSNLLTSSKTSLSNKPTGAK